MRAIVLFAATLGLCLAVLAPVQGAGLAVGSKAPDFTLKDPAGKVFKLSEAVPRQVTVLDFGRFTCVPCRTMMGELQKLHVKYGGRGVGIYSVNMDGPSARRTAAASALALGVQFPVLLDTRLAVAQSYGVTGIPQVVVIDPGGIIQFVHVGYEPQLPAALAALIEKYRPAPVVKLPRLLVVQGAECVGCGPMPSILKEMKATLEGKLEVDIRAYNADLVEKYELESVPAQIFFDSAGVEVARHEGPMTRDEIVEQLQKMGIAVGAAP